MGKKKADASGYEQAQPRLIEIIPGRSLRHGKDYVFFCNFARNNLHMKVLFIINEAPYGNEKMYNALRLAHQLKKNDPDSDIRVFLMADAVTAALPGQETPEGYYNTARMLKLVLNNGGAVKLCGSCARARGLARVPLLAGTQMSDMEELATWTIESDRVLVF